MIKEKPLYDDDYTGIRYRYGIKRPPSPNCIPLGFICGSHRGISSKYRHGTIDYPRPLSDKEIYDFEMKFDSILDPNVINQGINSSNAYE